MARGTIHSGRYINDQKKLVILGSGEIVRFHIEALRAAGFKINSIFSRPGSLRLQGLSRSYQVPMSGSFQEFSEQTRQADGVLLALETSAMERYAEALSSLGTPMLLEKPAALSSESLLRLKQKNPQLVAFVAYNRRFYESARYAKSLKPGILSVSAFWPEPTKSDEAFLKNGVHFVDFLRFVFGELTISQNQSLGKDKGFTSLLISDDNGFPVTFQAVFGAIANPEVKMFLDDGTVFEIRPLESSRLFNEFEVFEPTEKRNIRVYEPRYAEMTIEESSNFKPGFLAQAKEFMEICSRPSADKEMILPTLEDAARTLRLAENLVSRFNQPYM